MNDIARPDHRDFTIAEAQCKLDRFFVYLLWGHFLFSLLLSFWYHTFSQALLIGLPAVLVPTVIARLNPGSLLTRSCVGAALMIYSALYIQQSHGLTEMHFHVFSALAFLLAYRDWRPIVLAAGVIAVQHLSFALLQMWQAPIFIYSSALNPFVLTLIHAAFVIFETSILIWLASVGLKEWQAAEELSRFTRALADSRLDANDLTVRLQWDTASSLAPVAEALDGVLDRLCVHLAEAKEHVSQITGQAQKATENTAQAQEESEHILAAIQQVSAGAQRQSERAVGVAVRMEEATRLAGDLAASVVEQSQLTQNMAGNIAHLQERAQEILFASREQVLVTNEARAAVEKAIAAAASTTEAARQAKSTVHEAVQEASQGREVLSQAVADVAQQIDQLGQRSQQVRAIVETVSSIADQTNLLALNAAIEAARAGENGRGFAVVADEVRKLAARSSQATQDIHSLITIMTNEIEAVLMAMRGRESKDGLSERTTATLTKVESAFTGVMREFAAVEEAAMEVHHTGKQAADRALQIAEIAQHNQRRTEATNELTCTLQDHVQALQKHALDQGNIAEVAAEQARSTNDLVKDMAAVTEETTASVWEVEQSVGEQSRSFVRLAGSVSRVSAFAGQVRRSMERFRTVPDADTATLDSDRKDTLLAPIGAAPQSLDGAKLDEGRVQKAA
jgi:methyl-accepting chemotaxis protein